MVTSPNRIIDDADAGYDDRTADEKCSRGSGCGVRTRRHLGATTTSFATPLPPAVRDTARAASAAAACGAGAECTADARSAADRGFPGGADLSRRPVHRVVRRRARAAVLHLRHSRVVRRSGGVLPERAEAEGR